MMTQAITPELKRWIVEQAQAGFAPEAVLKAMQDAGWQQAVALDALETTLQEYLQRQTPTRSMKPVPVDGVPGRTAGAVAFPRPPLDGAPRCIDVDGRKVDVLINVHCPRLVVFGGFLSDEECDGLISAARPRMSRSLTVQTSTGGEEVNDDRTSQGMFFRRGENELVARIEARIARLLQWPVESGEGVQVLHYRPGAEYKPHYDYFDPKEPGTASITRRGGQRVATLVMYLNEPARGGGTVFPDLGLEVMPKRGHAVYFGYERPHPSTRTLHGGSPVIEGEKWVATKWLREREFA